MFRGGAFVGCGFRVDGLRDLTGLAGLSSTVWQVFGV